MRLIGLVVLSWLMFAPAWGHEIRPAYLELVETRAGVFDVNWKQPVADGRRLALDPVLPSECAALTEPAARFVNAATVTRWQVECPLQDGLISIAGLELTLTDVFVEARYLNGEIKRAVIRPGEAGLELSTATDEAAPAYLRLGVEHILSGPDHLLFVTGLLLLTRLRTLFFVITAFTLAHSLTLGLTSLGVVRLSPAPVETMIAISILLLAVEAVRVLRGEESLTARKPWLVSFGFGLLHGFGFAGALGEIGLPEGAELAALLYFNIGVEVGQVLFICTLLFIGLIGKFIFGKNLNRLRMLSAYGVGTMGAFWVFERFGSLLTA